MVYGTSKKIGGDKINNDQEPIIYRFKYIKKMYSKFWVE